jgi:hypothetical protein
MRRKLLGIINVNFKTTCQLLIFCICHILEKKWEYSEAVHQFFIDFKKAYDSIKRKETGQWGKLHNEEINDRYSTPYIVQVIKLRRMSWVEHVSRMGERRGVYRVLVGKPEGKRPLWRTRHRWEDNIKMDLQNVECGGMDWIELAQDRDRWWELVNTIMNLQVP